MGKISEAIEYMGIEIEKPTVATILKNQFMVKIADGFAIVNDKSDLPMLQEMTKAMGMGVSDTDIFENKLYDKKVMLLRNIKNLENDFNNKFAAVWRENAYIDYDYSKHVLEPSVVII